MNFEKIFWKIFTALSVLLMALGLFVVVAGLAAMLAGHFIVGPAGLLAGMLGWVTGDAFLWRISKETEL